MIACGDFTVGRRRTAMRMSRRTIQAVLLATGFWLIGSTARITYAEDARPLYDKNCASCHGPNGKGDGPAGKILKPPAPDLSTTVKKASDADLAKIIKEGGKAVGRSAAMPAYGAKLTDDQIQGLVQLVKGFASK